MGRSRKLLTLAVVFLLAESCALAAMGTKRGLPMSWQPTAARGYGTVNSVDGNPASAMCVECHTANPSATIAYTLPTGDLDKTMHAGSHFVVNRLDGKDNLTAVFAAEYKGNWSSGRPSKYGVLSGAIISTQTAGQDGEVICETCHNIIKNKGQSLLLEDFSQTTGDSTLCEVCHISQSGGPPNHHPMTGHNVGPDKDQGVEHELDITHMSHLKDPNLTSAATGGIKFFPTQTYKMTCVSCHTPHNAATATGARALRRGKSTSSDGLIAGKAVNVALADGNPHLATRKGDIVDGLPLSVPDPTGIHRQSDMDSGYRLVVNMDPLCNACH